MEQEDRPMGVKEAAAFTGYSVWYIYKLVSRRKIPCYKSATGGRVVFRRTELETFMYRVKQSAAYELSDQADRIVANIVHRGRYLHRKK